MVIRFRSVTALVTAGLMWSSSLTAHAQQPAAHDEVGIVYYADGAAFKPLDKEPAPQSGRSTYAARIRQAHATVRLVADKPQVFRVCGVDPTRYKLYKFKTEGKTRTLTITRNNMLIGGSKVVVSDSEVPLSIQATENNCYTLTPRKTLDDGEFGFSPLESLDAFMFGVGDPKQSK